MRHTRSLSLLFAVPLGAVLAMSAAARADTVGTAGAVNTSSSGTAPGAPTRVIEIGAQVVANEKIQTTGTGSVQVLFIDKTTLNVGPNSTLVIDRFVYNPATTSGQLALSLGKGVVRVVGGIATHSEGATIRTPVAAIGLRGGIAIISHSGAKGTQAILGFGHMSVTTLCGGGGNCSPNTVQLSRPGFSVTVAGFNKSLSSPGRASSDELARANGQLTSKGGQSGGASQQPTDSQAQSYNVGTPDSPGARVVTTTGTYAAANAVQALATTGTISRAAAQNSGSIRTTQTVITQALLKQVTPPPSSGGGGGRGGNTGGGGSGGNGGGGGGSGGGGGGGSGGGGGGGTPVTPVKPPPPPLTYAMVTSGPFHTSTGSVSSQSPVPYLTGAFAGTGGFKVSQILGYQTGGATTSRQFQAGLSVTGQGAAQNATLFVMTSQISNAPNTGFTQAGGFTGVTVRNPEGWYGLAGGSVSSATPTSSPNTVSTMNGTPIAGFTLNNTNTSSNFVRAASSNSSSNYTFNPITTATPTFSAGAHPDLTLNGGLNGYVGGVMVTATGGTPTAPTKFTNPYVITNVTGQPGNVTILLPGNSSEMLAVFNVGSGVGAPSGAMTSSSYVFGSVGADTHPGLNGARGAYINPSNFAAQAAESVNGVPASSRNGVPLAMTTGGFANQQLVTAESVGANTSAFLTSISSTAVKPCACDSTQWGFWSAFNGGKDSSGQPFQDQGPLLLWVAGVPTTTGALSTATGTATYTGHAIASIANPNNITSYLAAGTFSAAVNFGRQNGQITIGGLDGTNYAGTAAWVKGTTSFATPAGSPLIGSNGGRTAALAGSFFQGGPTNISPLIGEMGGSLILNGTATNPYLGSGIFAAVRTK
jgi:hypothetical protein